MHSNLITLLENLHSWLLIAFFFFLAHYDMVGQSIRGSQDQERDLGHDSHILRGQIACHSANPTATALQEDPFTKHRRVE